jgi:predicted HicB family RNase H-like nuclease
MKKPHPNTGNTYRRRADEPSTRSVLVRLTPTEHERWQSQAKAANMSLAALIRERFESKTWPE